jgi:predicted transcriptional regulator
MRLGLKQKLFTEIQQQGAIRLDEAYQFAHDAGYDYENCKRRLRELMNTGLVEPIKNEKRFIIGYRYISDEKPKVQIQTFPQLSLTLK